VKKTASGYIIFKPTEEACRVKAANDKKLLYRCVPPEVVRRDAVAASVKAHSPRHSLRLTKVSTSTYKSRNKQSVVPGVDTVNRLVAFIVWCKIVLFYHFISVLVQVLLF